MEVDYQGIGRRIRAARQTQGISQEKLADLVDLSKPHMSHIETGTTKVSLPTLLRIANSLGCTLDTLAVDSLENAAPLYQNGLHQELEDCTAEELATMEEMIRALKTSLRRRRKQAE